MSWCCGDAASWRWGWLRAENDRLCAEIAGLRGQLQEAWRAGTRQAASFSSKAAEKDSARRGRKSGERYVTTAQRPPPERVDEEIRVALPEACPCCGGDP